MADDRTENGLSAGYGKGWLRARGSYVVALLLVGALVALGWREFDRAAVAMLGEHARILVAQEILAKEVSILSYLTSLPVEERPRLLPPPGLWERVDQGPPRARPGRSR